MLTKIKNAIELTKQTRRIVYQNGENLEKVISKEGMIFGVSKNGEDRVFFDAKKAKEWKKNTGGTLCNVYHILGICGGQKVLELVTSCQDMKADLKTWLKIRGVTIKELSEVLGIKYPTLTNWVSKKSLPDIVSGQKIAKELNLSPAQIEW